MQVNYGSWSHLDASALIKLITEDSHEVAKYIIEDMLNEAYNEGEYDGTESGFDQGVTSASEDAGHWVRNGDYDDEVKTRASALGYIKGSESFFDLKQSQHRQLHADGPYGWEYCARC